MVIDLKMTSLGKTKIMWIHKLKEGQNLSWGLKTLQQQVTEQHITYTFLYIYFM